MHHTPPTSASSHDHPAHGFSHTRQQFEYLVDYAIAHAKKLGATDVGAEASEGCGLSVSVRKGELENVERNRDKSLVSPCTWATDAAMPALRIFQKRR